jgi:NAD-dependent SIR2 family protein deacetylase
MQHVKIFFIPLQPIIGTFMGKIKQRIRKHEFRHRYNIYKEKSPHYGFHRLLKLAERVKEGNYFCVTSNVDGHFQRAGFPNKKISEIHGSISHYQCNKCRIILPFEIDKFELDHQQSICLNLPKCKYCNCIIRFL